MSAVVTSPVLENSENTKSESAAAYTCPPKLADAEVARKLRAEITVELLTDSEASLRARVTRAVMLIGSGPSE